MPAHNNAFRRLLRFNAITGVMADSDVAPAARYDFDKIIVLSDERGTPDNMIPTQANIMKQLELLIPSNPGANFFFAYSGHSDQRPDESGEEEDGLEEYIIPCDAMDRSGKVVEDLIITDKVGLFPSL
ncbi:hypothetical protein CVT25_010486 [Psilocybe cyanescens]|uniref:Metacaspase n=1 Tax=Psilocybe cyanescens TaxID=93625 RepID=A0A409XDH4_PSICY|nr:hypothetical protein CVT25_010486 [Psilocybe cyanescens]